MWEVNYIMEELKALKETYLAIGVGGLSFICIVLILWFVMKNIQFWYE